jgi:hypothetical protein
MEKKPSFGGPEWLPERGEGPVTTGAVQRSAATEEQEHKPNRQDGTKVLAACRVQKQPWIVGLEVLRVGKASSKGIFLLTIVMRGTLNCFAAQIRT